MEIQEEQDVLLTVRQHFLFALIPSASEYRWLFHSACASDTGDSTAQIQGRKNTWIENRSGVPSVMEGYF